MLVYIIRRLVNVVVLLLVVSAVTFGVFFMVPKLTGSDPALLYVGKNTDKVAVEGARHKMGLDKPIATQYGLFVKGIVAGRDFDFGTDKQHCSAPCFGYSFKTEQEVWPVLLSDLPVTASLASGAAVIWLTTGVGTGVVSALKRRSVLDRVTMVTALAGVSLPIYFTGLLSLAVFSYGLGWVHADYVGITENPAQWANTLFPAWCSLALLYSAIYARLTRSGMLETMNEDFIRTARAKGLAERQVVARHGLRAALTPIITVFGMDLGLLLGGALITERVFSLHGIGEYAVQSINDNDLPPILGVTLLAAFFIVICNLLVDLLYAAADPRVRLS